MSAPALPVRSPRRVAPAKPLAAERSPLYVLDRAMRAIASLKLTVALFAFAIYVVLVGTLAQTQMDIWQVVREYFHAWVMWVDINLFFPKSFFPDMPLLNVPLIPAPGGLTVGILMALNLLAAHAWRFKIQAAGARLWGGLAVLLAGIALTALVIVSGHNDQGFQAKPPFTWDAFWTGFLLFASAVWAAGMCAYAYYGLRPATQGEFSWVRLTILIGSGLLLVAMAGVLGWGALASQRPSDEAIRIVWQLLQGGLSGIVLLAGCVLVFQKRGGMVLLHLGIGLLMVNELLVARQAVEWQISLHEGETTNFLNDIRTTELALIDVSGDKTDEHSVVPLRLLERNLATNAALPGSESDKQPMSIQSDLLPVQVAVLEYYKNSDVEAVKPGEKNIATAGRGLKEKLVSLPAAKGTDTGGAVDYAGAYVQLTSPDGKDLGTYMVSQLASLQLHPERFAEKVTVGGKEYLMFLRFKRAYLPFTVSLIDVRKDDYIASNTPRNYSSDIRLNDPAAGVDQSVHIKMNDPLRYRSMTIYQSGYDRTERGEITALQVVYNRIWMIPYVACAIVGIGMVAHFLITVTRFVVRRENEERADAGAIDLEFAPQPTLGAAKGSQLQPQLANSRGKQFNWSLVGLPVLAASLFLAMVAAASRTTEAPPDELDLARFGRLPVADEGRLKPFDSLARTSLTTISNRDYVKLEDGTKLSAIEWLLDVITGKLDVTTGKEASQNYRVIRIEHPDLLKLFELEERPGSLRYSVKEIQPQMDRFLAQLAPAEELGRKDASKLTVTQKKLLQLNERLKEYVSLVQSFSNPRLPDLPTQQEFEQTPEVANQKIDALRLAIFQSGEAMKQINAPRPIPLDMPDGTTQEEHWHAFPNAVIMSFLKTNVMGEDADPVTVSFSKILAAYQEQDATIFNRELARYESLVAKQQPPLLVPGKIASEAEFNRIKPFSLGMYAYLAAFMLGIFGWLLRWKPLNWTSFTLILLAFLLHTAALVARIYISGRPPVTNLYSSAVFIGWAVVIFGLLIEGIFRLGLGNIVAAVAGYATLLIASYLALDGDTIAVLQAVLDTQFWLATHVVCITLGYAATYAAGLLGILYVVFGMATPLLDSRSRKDLGRMIYGITCFAILFSFVGTVLGGLWADDSWGRFWGWDPKENGALIIVLWNALVLHARWDKMIGDRGLAVLAVGGNIVTSWSWFGVNQLGIGLHSYGFTSGVALALTAFVGSQLLLIVVGSLPKSLWWSFSAERAA